MLGYVSIETTTSSFVIAYSKTFLTNTSSKLCAHWNNSKKLLFPHTYFKKVVCCSCFCCQRQISLSVSILNGKNQRKEARGNKCFFNVYLMQINVVWSRNQIILFHCGQNVFMSRSQWNNNEETCCFLLHVPVNINWQVHFISTEAKNILDFLSDSKLYRYVDSNKLSTRKSVCFKLSTITEEDLLFATAAFMVINTAKNKQRERKRDRERDGEKEKEPHFRMFLQASYRCKICIWWQRFVFR